MTPKELEHFPAVIRINVQWGEMDAYQHVNNTVYFRYFESARIAYLQKLNFSDPAQTGGIGPILGHTQCKFIRPLAFPDTVSVAARTIEIREDRFIMELKIYSHKLGKLAAVGTADMVAFDYQNFRKARLPQSIRESIEALEGRTFGTSSTDTER
ncbi:MAG: acyl-CoA thioesterase [Calditrichaeota bacterium]|nr:MAG: acyl-CoA thioesterase [Calditrichota bacterium]